MHRRDLITSALGALAAGPALAASSLAGLAGLPRTARMPVLFVGHGSPMNVIQDNPWRPQWEGIGKLFGREFPKPALILCISAHWLTDGWWITGADKPKTIHDFGGFPQALFDQQYPAPGAPDLARAIADKGGARKLRLDATGWGYDHGAWSVLKPMFPAADIPVLPLAWVPTLPPAQQFALGEALAALRHEGVLVMGTGSITHNLRRLFGARRPALDAPEAADSAAFRGWMHERAQARDWEALFAYRQQAPHAPEMHPTDEHLLPWYVAAGAGGREAAPQRLHEAVTYGSLGMDAYAFGTEAAGLAA